MKGWVAPLFAKVLMNQVMVRLSLRVACEETGAELLLQERGEDIKAHTIPILTNLKKPLAKNRPLLKNTF
jgi:hypothetical protein